MIVVVLHDLGVDHVVVVDRRRGTPPGWVRGPRAESGEEGAGRLGELHPQGPVRSLEKALLGFLEAIEDDGVSVGLDVNGDESWAEPRVLDESFLIIREATRNALTHGAPSVILRCSRREPERSTSASHTVPNVTPRALWSANETPASSISVISAS